MTRGTLQVAAPRNVKKKEISMKRLHELTKHRSWAALLIGAALFTPVSGYAQSAVVGALGNFDAGNFEGKDAHGMEIQIEGIQLNDLTPSWCGNKYNCPVVIPYATGVYVRYMSPYDSVNKVFTATTVPLKSGSNFAGTCYTWVASYQSSGCDHFGVHLAYTAAANNAVTTAYRDRKSVV